MHWSGEVISVKNASPVKLAYQLLIFITFYFAIFPLSIKSAEKLSADATISILTCGPGEPLYAAFGHTALMVKDSVNQIDKVFNYGTFDVTTPKFYLKFLTGRLNYALSVSDFKSFLEEYKAENRWVYNQELIISHLQKQKIYDSLMVVLEPENRFYRYDFFRDNCSTRIIDLVLFFSAGPQMIDSLKAPFGKTFRQGLNAYIGGREWLNLGINMLLGPFADQSMSKLESTFLPDNLMHIIEEINLAGTSVEILGNGYQPPAPKDPNVPMVLFWVVALILVFEALWSKSSSEVTDIVDAMLFTVAGILGLLFVFFWIWSDHESLHVNLNLFWASPFNFLLAWAIIKRKKILIKVLSILVTLLLFFMLINWIKLPQSFPLDMMPIVTALAFRAVNRIFNFKAKDRSLTSKDLA